MDEDEYRATYRLVNEQRCVFEKAINSRICGCEKARRFNLADREGVACSLPAGNELCRALLDQLRSNARFALHLTRVEGPLPHSKEIRVQNGGLFGLQKVVDPEAGDLGRIPNIYGVAVKAVTRYGGLDRLPYPQIMQSILAYQGRRRPPRKGGA